MLDVDVSRDGVYTVQGDVFGAVDGDFEVPGEGLAFCNVDYVLG